MSNDLTFGIKLTGDGKELRDELVQTNGEVVKLTKSSDDFNKSSSRMASSYSGLNTVVKEHSAAVTVTDGKVAKLMDRYDPLGAKLRQLQADFKALDRAAAGGKIAGGDDARVDQVYVNLQKEIAATQAATANFGTTTRQSMQGLGLNTQYARREMMQLGKEAVSGDFSQMPRTFASLATHSNILPALISPIGLAVAGVTAVVAAGGFAWYEWGRKAEEASKRAADALKDAEKHAKEASAGVQRTQQEQLTALENKLQSAQGELKHNTQQALRKDLPADDTLKFSQTAGAWRAVVSDLQRQKTDLEKQIADKETKTGDSKKDFIAALQREAETYGFTSGQIKIYEAQKRGISGDDLKLVKKLAAEVDAHKAAEQAVKDHASAVAEANKIIAGIDPIARAGQEWEKLLALNAQGLLSEDQMAKAYVKSFENIKTAGTDTYTALEAAMRGWGNNFTNTLAKAVQTGKLNFSDLRDSIISDLLKIAIQKNITDNLIAWGTAGLSAAGSYVQSLFNNANGNAFGVDGAMAFAAGGAFSNKIYSEPTYFAFGGQVGGARLGVMGEAGPEAVMPLSRGSDGKLGVRAQGGGGQVIVNQPINIDARGADLGVEQRIRAMMPGLLAENQRVIVATVQQAVAARGRSL